MSLPGWVGVREPRGRLGGRYAKTLQSAPPRLAPRPKVLYTRSTRDIGLTSRRPPPRPSRCQTKVCCHCVSTVKSAHEICGFEILEVRRAFVDHSSSLKTHPSTGRSLRPTHSRAALLLAARVTPSSGPSDHMAHTHTCGTPSSSSHPTSAISLPPSPTPLPRPLPTLEVPLCPSPGVCVSRAHHRRSPPAAVTPRSCVGGACSSYPWPPPAAPRAVRVP